MAQEAFELHELLVKAAIAGPYVMVGQSVGGLLVRLYALRYANDVAGVVLVDPTHESGVLGSLRYGGMVRLREKATGRAIPTPTLLGPADVMDPPDSDYMAEELAQLYRARLDRPRMLGRTPLVVLAAGKRPAAPPGIAAAEWARLRDERDEQVRDLTELSANAIYFQDSNSGHAIHSGNPSLVVRAIHAVLDAIATGRPVELPETIR
jgi:pimeloyl-ACP methyl ester carboxylesterase